MRLHSRRKPRAVHTSCACPAKQFIHWHSLSSCSLQSPRVPPSVCLPRRTPPRLDQPVQKMVEPFQRIGFGRTFADPCPLRQSLCALATNQAAGWRPGTGGDARPRRQLGPRARERLLHRHVRHEQDFKKMRRRKTARHWRRPQAQTQRRRPRQQRWRRFHGETRPLPGGQMLVVVRDDGATRRLHRRHLHRLHLRPIIPARWLVDAHAAVAVLRPLVFVELAELELNVVELELPNLGPQDLLRPSASNVVKELQ
mmetsp:Transcript_99145/g.251776  ORF Transcript_99145/g.251776 Transcript_99145/m.251776 type:complete len:255 (+) Transcript_99145:20-784(+)